MTQNITPLIDKLGFSPIAIQLLICLRWVAIVGQLTTILTIYYGFQFDLPVFQVSIVIGLSFLVNLFFTFTQKNRHFIPQREVLFYLLYDLGQLTTVLYLSGGLNNPFSVLILAPVVIAAGFLPQKKSVILYVTSLSSLLFLALSPYPLPWGEKGLTLPYELRLGIAISLATGIIFIAFYVMRVTQETRLLGEALEASRSALAREQRLASLGALAAAAAHELGSPLTTISLITKELLTDKSCIPHYPDLTLIMDQLKRCRHILAELAKNFAGEKTLPYDQLPLTAAIDFIVQRLSKTPGKILEILKEESTEEPIITLTPEFIHGLYNILENGWQYASTKLIIHLKWDSKKLLIEVHDNGPGYDPSILNRLGEPYVSSRTFEDAQSHLGLGLFIAQTLLAQINGKLYFRNQNGACCLIELNRS